MMKITEYTISQFDFDLINHIKTLRLEKKISQEQLSISMGLARSFVGNVENINESHKYSTRHLTLLARAFGYKNISDLMKFPTPQYDRIKVTVKQTMNESGTKALSSEVVKIEHLK
ncbi:MULTISPECIES: helix-turn-helix domain-containing protein [Flavobacterium]|jgi:transcriptional regulator with XRE-family HTH domain|uniref:XRE family transcriptional regulator n=2 Tax=Flavobacterium TaxID=237 RepID=A0A4R5CWV5_9FLAO|nr:MULTISPECIES: helix-turn-helix transcriptional regulator [Flavobacterium]TDD77213.1 XRE family transcriptional regulator [Flavobacterium caseinilyticum]TDE04227.1 XRE family transcriptional regulator [Flavobacterium sandaracinum]